MDAGGETIAPSRRSAASYNRGDDPIKLGVFQSPSSVPPSGVPGSQNTTMCWSAGNLADTSMTVQTSHGGTIATTARLSRRKNSYRSSGRYGLIGTATEPCQIVPRKDARNAGVSGKAIKTRCSAATSRPARTPAKRPVSSRTCAKEIRAPL